MDSKGVGLTLFDVLTVPTYDDELGVTYPAWTVCDDKQLQISSDTVIKDKIQRTLSNNAEEVIIPIAGTPEINSNMHLAMQKSLKSKEIHFLIDDQEFEYKHQIDDPIWTTKTSEEKAEILLPYLETRFMINESVTLNTEYKNGNVKVVEDRSARKDRYSATTMFNYFGDKLKSKYIKDENDDDIDISEWSFLAGY